MAKKIHAGIDKLDDYDRFLLETLIQQAEKTAGKTLSLKEKQKMADDFFAERPRAGKGHLGRGRKGRPPRNLSADGAQESADFHWTPGVPLRKVQEAQRRNRNMQTGQTPSEPHTAKK